jgi:phosphoenolpyruvate synthase/pyruvate phosphate dikinase/glycerol-3-phosphate acyltransferase PlsY
MDIMGVLIIVTVCPILGGLPLIDWIVRGLTQQRLNQLGTRNISVSAAFYHGGKWVGTLAVVSEALKGIVAVMLARLFFPANPAWEVVALIALVVGRYWFSRGAGTTNVVWGYVVHDWVSAGLIFLISGVGFTILRERKLGRLGVLVLLPFIAILRYPYDAGRFGANIALGLLLAWIYHKIPDDLELPTNSVQKESQQMFQFLRGDRAIRSLEQTLKPDQVGAKAATLAQLRRWSYPVLMGWVLPPGDDPAPLIELLHPTPDKPLVVRSSAIGEDSSDASAAGVYESILDVTSKVELEQAIIRCQVSYNHPSAVHYRQERGLPEGGMAVLVQPQVNSVFSGVAFSRDPIARHGDAVIIEALPGAASQVVSGRFTPEQYRVWVTDADLAVSSPSRTQAEWLLPDEVTLPLEGSGDVPPRLIQQVAYLARQLESKYHGIPQDIEWSYDGQRLWLLQCRPITTLTPMWTRKIAAEVIPGHIRPLTWSINQPLTCGVWGALFTLVLGDRARGLDFRETATLHNSSAYFNVSLLGQLFRRMGLPPESLEFLTRGAKFSKPPLTSTLRNLPGLLRLLKREMELEKDFNRDDRQRFAPMLAELQRRPARELAPDELISRIDYILDGLQRVTYYSILAPLSLALRQAISKVQPTQLDNSRTPEVASLRSLEALAIASRPFIPQLNELPQTSASVFAALAEYPDGRLVLEQLDEFLQRYGYLSEVGTDIAVPTWSEAPNPVRDMFVQFLFNSTAPSFAPKRKRLALPQRKVQQVQQRLNLKGRVSIVYSRLLAELRWSFVALEAIWIDKGWLDEPGDIFFLKFDEIRALVEESETAPKQQLKPLVNVRRSQWESDRRMAPIPYLVYGNEPPVVAADALLTMSQRQSSRQLQGIGASPGRVEGKILVLTSFQNAPQVNRDTILVVPYTDSGWAPLLARVGGLIAEVGGRLSHGAIVAREYGIPAVMDIHDATHQFYNGQQVRIDGQQGIVEIL